MYRYQDRLGRLHVSGSSMVNRLPISIYLLKNLEFGIKGVILAAAGVCLIC
jgi:hypothetical protein